MKRIFLFLATNLAVLALLTVVIFVIERVFGGRLPGGGLGGLLVFAAICGFGGRNMTRAQIEAVLGHEISHVSNGDMVTLALLQGVLNTFVIFVARTIGSVVDRALFKNDREESGIGFFLTTLVAQIVLGILASMIASWYSRRREFRADRGGAKLAGTGSMIAALQVLKRSQEEPMPPQLEALGINAGRKQGFMRLFMTHPPLDERIAALQT
jgi:heat shock protein HtpX